jgi:hypothetical protein
MSQLPRPEYKSITVTTKVYDILYEEWEKEKDTLAAKHGVRSFSGYICYRLNQIIEETPTDQFKMLNHDGDGVKIQDKKLARVADVNITPKGIYCPLCDASNCEHIRYAIAQPDIQDLIKQKRREGWHLPDP